MDFLDGIPYTEELKTLRGESVPYLCPRDCVQMLRTSSLLTGLLCFVLSTSAALAEMPPDRLGAESLRFLSPQTVLRYAPDHANAVIFTKVDTILISPAAEQLCKRYETLQRIRREVSQEAGFDPAELSSTLLIGDTNSPRPIMVVQTLREADLEHILQTRRSGETFVTEMIGRQKVFFPAENQWALAATQTDSRTLILGRAEELRAVLTRDRDAKLSPMIQAQVESLNYSLPLCVVFDVTSMPKHMKEDLIEDVGIPESIFKQVQGIKLEVCLNEPLYALGSAICDSAETAREVEKTARFVLGMAKLAGTIPAKAQPLIKALKFDTHENLARAAWTMPLEEAHQHLEGFFPRVGNEDAP